MELIDPHVIFDGLSLLTMAGGAYVGVGIKNILLQIKVNQLIDRADIIKGQNEIKTDLEVHKTEDKGDFRGIHESLNRIESNQKTMSIRKATA